jgi:hypothetical protein
VVEDLEVLEILEKSFDAYDEYKKHPLICLRFGLLRFILEISSQRLPLLQP